MSIIKELIFVPTIDAQIDATPAKTLSAEEILKKTIDNIRKDYKPKTSKTGETIYRVNGTSRPIYTDH